MEPVYRIDPNATIRRFIPIQWKVEKGSWCINYIWMWLSDMGLLEAFNEMSGEEQYQLLVAEFGED